MTSQDQFEAWAAEHLPTLYLTKTDQGTYESTATGNFFAVWSARDGEIEALRASNHTIECRFEVSEDTLKTIRGCLASAERDIDQLKAGNSRLQGELHAGSDLIATCRRVNREIRSDRDQLKATVSDYEMGLEAAKEEIARLKGEVEGLSKDAKRYRWMRDIAPRLLVETPLIAMCTEDGSVRYRDHGSEMLLSGADADSAIDAAMSKGEQP